MPMTAETAIWLAVLVPFAIVTVFLIRGSIRAIYWMPFGALVLAVALASLIGGVAAGGA